MVLCAIFTKRIISIATVVLATAYDAQAMPLQPEHGVQHRYILMTVQHPGVQTKSSLLNWFLSEMYCTTCTSGAKEIQAQALPSLAIPQLPRRPGCCLQVTVSYGQKPNEIFLQFYGFVDTSYASDFYTADLLEYVQQQQGVPEDRLETLQPNLELLQAVESVSVLLDSHILSHRYLHMSLHFRLPHANAMQEQTR